MTTSCTPGTIDDVLLKIMRSIHYFMVCDLLKKMDGLLLLVVAGILAIITNTTPNQTPHVTVSMYLERRLD